MAKSLPSILQHGLLPGGLGPGETGNYDLEGLGMTSASSTTRPHRDENGDVDNLEVHDKDPPDDHPTVENSDERKRQFSYRAANRLVFYERLGFPDGDAWRAEMPLLYSTMLCEKGFTPLMLRFRTLAKRKLFGLKETVLPMEVTHFRGRKVEDHHARVGTSRPASASTSTSSKKVIITSEEGLAVVETPYEWIPLRHGTCAYEVEVAGAIPLGNHSSFNYNSSTVPRPPGALHQDNPDADDVARTAMCPLMHVVETCRSPTSARVRPQQWRRRAASSSRRKRKSMLASTSPTSVSLSSGDVVEDAPHVEKNYYEVGHVAPERAGLRAGEDYYFAEASASGKKFY
ncbi:unnamed protein product [Amoebophrya sp. A120]|nr:unnamed protein product [Amoebophrya sp. A120]|eukprot:GSA120T00007166001.1